MQMRKYVLGLCLAVIACWECAWAADAATVIFDGGQTIRIDDGFRQIAEAMKGGKPEVLELAVGNATVILRVREVLVLCREECRGVGIKHQLDPKGR